MNTDELIKDLPEERKEKIRNLLHARQNWTDPKERAGLSRELNREVKDLNLKYCPTMETLLHTDQFYVTYKTNDEGVERAILTTSIPALEMYHNGYRSEHGVDGEFYVEGRAVDRTAPHGEGGFGETQIISDELYGELTHTITPEALEDMDEQTPKQKLEQSIKDSIEVGYGLSSEIKELYQEEYKDWNSINKLKQKRDKSYQRTIKLQQKLITMLGSAL